MPKKRTPGKEKWFWSYRSVMDRLKISRRTLQRWLDDLNIDPLEFEDHLKVFLGLPQVQLLEEYGKFMAVRDQSMIKRFREAIQNKNNRRLGSLRRELAEKQVAVLAEKSS